MFWYLFLVASPILMVPIVTYGYKKSIDGDNRAKKTYLLLCGTILFLMIALRHYSLGSVDSSSYYNNWILLSKMPFASLLEFMKLSDMESGYLFAVWCLPRVFPSAQFLFVLTGLLFSFAICRTIYLNSENVMISMIMCICLGLYTFMIQGLRQGIAMSICMLSLELCQRRRFIPFLLVVLLAMLFHKSAIVFILLYFVYGLKFNVNTKIAMGITMATLSALSPLIVRYGNEFLDREYFNAVESGAVVAVLIHIIIVAVAFIFLNDRNTDKKDVFFIWMIVLGMTFYLMRYFGTQALERISFYFLIGQAIVLPTVVSKFKYGSRKIIYLAVCILSICLFFYRLNASYGLDYMFFWEG